ncbi:MAG: NusB antitermination factor [Marmoricola sp.]|nr:NusB antitermination factor [Marmoricola sp.]
MSARSKARKRALDVVYAAEVRNRSALEQLAEVQADLQVNDYTVELVHGVEEHRARLDEVISDHLEGWTLGRMPAVDRNVLRLATFEILYVDDVPDAVAVSEALHLVRDLSTDESPAYVNGVLGGIVRDREHLVG